MENRLTFLSTLAMSTTKPGINLELTPQRLEAFSDGVFAIAITLLIIEIKVPGHQELAHTTLAKFLLQYWPKYFAYVFSFVIIGIYWANHHFLFKLFKKTNHVFNLLNVLFLMTISFLPFPTAVLGEYILDEEQRKTAITFYSIGIALPALSWLLMWLYGSYKKRLIDHDLSATTIRYLNRKFTLSNILYLSAIIISLFSANIAIILNVILTLVYLLAPKKPQYD